MFLQVDLASTDVVIDGLIIFVMHLVSAGLAEHT